VGAVPDRRVTGPGGQPPLDALPPDAPATVEDVRSSRRWTWVALVWAVAASAIAVIALLQANDANSNDNPPQNTTQAASQQQLNNFQKQVNDRLDAFSKRLNDTASSSDVDKLNKQVSQIQDNQSKASDNENKQNGAITQLQSDVKTLQNQVKDLQNQQSKNNSGTSTTP
jgi:polyhydroxyalkanoate synthesis regulator phasin